MVRTPSNASSLSYRSGRGDPYTTSQSTVETTVAADGTLVTTYTTRTTTISEEPVRVTKQYLVKSSSDQPEYEEEFDLQPGTHRSSTKVTRHYSSASSSTLPREVPRVELSKPPGPSTLPRDNRPAATSTPDVLEEDVRNPDGTFSSVQRHTPVVVRVDLLILAKFPVQSTVFFLYFVSCYYQAINCQLEFITNSNQNSVDLRFICRFTNLLLCVD